MKHIRVQMFKDDISNNLIYIVSETFFENPLTNQKTNVFLYKEYIVAKPVDPAEPVDPPASEDSEIVNIRIDTPKKM